MTSARPTRWSQRQRRTAQRAAAAAQSASTPVMRGGDTAVGQQQQSGRRRPRAPAAAELPAELYNTSPRQFKTEDDYPTLAQNLREYLQAQKKTSLAAAVSDECSVEEYLRRPSRCCADKQVRRRINAMPGMRVAYGLHLLWQARFATVGEWAGVDSPVRVQNMSEDTYEIVKQAVRGAAARAAQRRRVESAGAEDEYGQTCKQLLPEGDGTALYKSVRDATWGALRYTTADRDNGVRAVSKGVAVLAQPLDDYGMELPHGDDDYAAQHDTKGDVLYTLHSRHGWPTRWSEVAEAVTGELPATAPVAAKSDAFISVGSSEYNSTLFVRYEVQRAWRNIAVVYNKRNPSAMLDTRPFVVQPPHAQTTQTSNELRPVAVLVYGAPGIGKTTSGNYMVYRLLHDDNAPRYIAFAVGESVYVFDKQHKRVSCYKRATFDRRDFVTACSRRCVYIHDCEKGKYAMGQFSHCHEALTVVLSSPNKKNYKDYMGNASLSVDRTYVVTHTWSYRELYCVAHLVGLDHDVMQDRVFIVGPLPRYVLNADSFDDRAESVREACAAVATVVDGKHPRIALTMAMNAADKKNPTNVLYDLRRSVRSALNSERATTGAASRYAIVVQRGNVTVAEFLNDLSGTIPRLMAKGMLQKMSDILLQQSNNTRETFFKLTAEVLSRSQSYELLVKLAIVLRRFWQQLHNSTDKDGMPRFRHCLVNGEPVAVVTPLTLADIQQWAAGYENTSFQVVEVDSGKLVELGAKVNVCVCVPLKRNFTLVDFFLLIRHDGGVHFVGVQATTGNQHPVTGSNIQRFIDDLPEIDIEPAATTAATHNAGRGSKRAQRDNSAAHDATARDGGDAATATSQQPSPSLSSQARQGGQRGTATETQDTRAEKLARLTQRIKSWSVLYIGEYLSITNEFNLQKLPAQRRQGQAGTATAAAGRAAAPATASRRGGRINAAMTSGTPAAGAARRRRQSQAGRTTAAAGGAVAPATAPRRGRDKAAVTSGTRAAGAAQRRQRQARHDAGGSATTTTDEAHQATPKVYIDFWDATHRYLYTAPPTHLNNITTLPVAPQQRRHARLHGTRRTQRQRTRTHRKRVRAPLRTRASGSVR